MKAKKKAKPRKAKAAPQVDSVEQLQAEVCDWIADGKTLRAWCRQEGKPSFKTVYRWIAADPAFAAAMEAARLVGADAIAEESLEIIDAEPDRVTVAIGEHMTRTTIDGAAVQHARNRVWHRMQLLAKWHPKKYGEKLELDGKLNVTPVLNILGSRRKAE